jgi:hypothetical protein
MCDLSGTGLMAVSTHFDIPFLSKRYAPLPFYNFPQVQGCFLQLQ